MEIRISNNVLSLTVDATLYSEAVLYKCFYWYADAFEVDIFKAPSSGFGVTLKVKDVGEIFDWDRTVQKIKQDLIDFKLRQIVTEETCTIRELIIAKAFSHYDETDTPLTAVGDPVGFDPQII